MQINRDLDQLAIKFFQEFSRSEYALKAAGFHNGDGDAKADWSSFAEQVEPLIQAPASETLSGAIEFVLDQPPKKQVIRYGLIQWSDANPAQRLKADNILIYVRRVRNNLFHGGKFNGRWFAPERSEQLIKHSLVILNACINYVPSTKEAYHG